MTVLHVFYCTLIILAYGPANEILVSNLRKNLLNANIDVYSDAESSSTFILCVCVKQGF